MYSISFPNMFDSSKTLLIKDHEATISNLKLLLVSYKGSLFGDPYFGTNLKKMFYEQNSEVLKDLLIDDIYTAIIIFMPQIKLTRKQIKLEQRGIDVYLIIEGLNLIDYVTDMFTINLTSEENT